ncbi:TPA: hypothetical protein DCX16_04815, partial [bacterium]|nr:hypothetical protein [bacterium]
FTGTSSFHIEGYLQDIGIREYVIVEAPRLIITQLSPSIVGKGTNILRISLKNPTQRVIKVRELEITLGSEKLEAEGIIFCNPGEEVIIEHSFSITEDATWTLKISGDYETETTFPIIFGERVEVVLLPEPVYREGWIEIPFTITNKGSLSSTFELSFFLLKDNKPVLANGYITIKSQESRVKSQESKIRIKEQELLKITIYIEPQELIEGAIHYEGIGLGEYKIGSSFFREEKQIPINVADENLALIKKIYLSDIDKILCVDIENTGANGFSGQLSILSSFISTTTSISLERLGTMTVKIPILPQEGKEVIKVSILYLGNKIDEKEGEFSFSPSFEIEKIETTTLNIGEQGTVTFVIKNTGWTFGRRDIFFSFLEFSGKREIFLDRGSSTFVQFSFPIDDDLVGGTYTGYLRIDQLHPIPLSIAGWELEIESSLDKAEYNEGECGTITIIIRNKNGLSGSLTVVFRDEGGEKRDEFYLESHGKQTSEFRFLATFHKKLFFGIYTESGRGLWLDAVYIRKKGDVAIKLKKDTFIPDEEVIMELEGKGSVTITTPGTPSTIEVFLPSTKTVSFFLPSFIKSGTYYIEWETNGKSGRIPFDVKGYSVLMLGIELDRGKYLQNEKFITTVKMQASHPGTYTISYWLKDTYNGFFLIRKEDVRLSSNETALSISDIFSSSYSGRHSLVVGVFKDDELLGISSEDFFLSFSDIAGFKIEMADEWVDGLPLDIKIYGEKETSTIPFFGKISILGEGFSILSLRNENGCFIGSLTFIPGVWTILASDGYFKGTTSIRVYPKNILKDGVFSFGSVSVKASLDGYIKIDFLSASDFPPREYIGSICAISFVPSTIPGSFTITFFFDKNLPGFDLGSIKAYYWKDNDWLPAENQVLFDDRVVVETLHFSTWTLMGKKITQVEKKAITYPNPWVLHKHRKNGISFENLLPESFLDIYNIYGERIFREIVPDSGKVVIYPNKLGWASGVYIWACSDYKGNKRIGKIGVIK